MNSFFEIETLIIDRLSKMNHKGGITKYEALVKSAISLNAKGCDGFIIMEIESMIDTTLKELGQDNLIVLYHDTEVGQEAFAQDVEPPCRESMIQDISTEVLEHVAEAACSEAAKRIIQKKKDA